MLYPDLVEEGATFPIPAPEYSKQMMELRLKVKCTRNPKAPKSSQNPDDLYQHSRGKQCHMTY